MKRLLLFLMFLCPFCTQAQLIESFDKPEITASYPWQGEVDKFRVNAEGELQLNAREQQGKASLCIQTVELNDNEWRCTVRSDYACTTQNYFNIYLWCRKPDMADPGEALFIRLGYTNKNVSLCYQEGNQKAEVLISGRTFFAHPATIDIKAVTDQHGHCTLYSKGISDADYYEEGTVELPLQQAYGYFMAGAYFSSAHSRDKYWDNIYIKRFSGSEPEPEIKDSIQIVSLKQESEKELIVEFNQPVVPEEASFSLTTIGEVNEIYQSDDNKTLLLVWEEALEKGKEYELSYTSLADLKGKKYAGSYTFIAKSGKSEDEEPEPYNTGSILINEIMADPKGLVTLPETEYVELYNASALNISLSGWQFLYGTTAVALNNYMLPPGGYVVLFREGHAIHADKNGGEMPLAKFPSQLANAGKALQLKDPAGKVIDQIEYPQAKPGIAWERAADSLYLSTDNRGGTPGSANSPQKAKPVPEVSLINPGEVIFNELLPDPFVGGSEYIELYNRSEKEINLSELSLTTRKSDKTLNAFYSLQSLPVTLKPKDYAVLTREKEGVTAFYATASAACIHEVRIPVLANTAADLVLLRSTDGVVIDEVSYTSQWHAAAVKDKKGVALERIDPDKNTQDGSNWTSAIQAAGFGTPGQQNSQYKKTNDNTAGIEVPQYSEQTGEYSIAYYLNEAGYSCRAWVFNLAGVQVARIAEHELLAASGQLVWNGMAPNGSRLKPGLYILYVSLYHPNGQVKNHKQVFLVH